MASTDHKGWGFGAVVATLVLLGISVCPAPLAEEEPGREKTRSFTNKDLEKYHNPKSPNSSGPVEAAETDPLAVFRDAEERRDWQERQLRQARKGIEILERQIEYWEARKLSIHNPLYPRPTPPGFLSEAGESDEGLDGVSLLERAEERQKELQEELKEARTRLLRMEREFRSPPQSQSPTPEKPSPPPPAP